MTLLCRLRGADRHIARRRLLLSVERVRLTMREISRGSARLGLGVREVVSLDA